MESSSFFQSNELLSGKFSSFFQKELTSVIMQSTSTLWGGSDAKIVDYFSNICIQGLSEYLKNYSFLKSRVLVDLLHAKVQWMIRKRLHKRLPLCYLSNFAGSDAKGISFIGFCHPNVYPLLLSRLLHIEYRFGVFPLFRWEDLAGNGPYERSQLL